MIFSPSLEILYRNSSLSFSEQIQQVHDLGFEAFEFWGWWNKDMEELKQLTRTLDIRAASFCTKPVPLVDAARRSEFLEGLQESIAMAQSLGCSYLIATTGNTLENVAIEDQLQSVIEGLQASAPLLENTGVTLILEPLNALVDHKGYFLNTSAEAVQIIDAVGSPSVKLLFDVYHQQITEGNLIPNITNYIDRIGYFHIADHPGRNEPGTGEINYSNVLEVIRKLGYSGYIGLEFRPTGDVSAALRPWSVREAL
jgi:hydroxypyruvate isomerase